MNERILQLIDFKQINKSIFYKKTGLSNGFLDKKGNIGSDKIEIILKTYPEISPDWLLTGSGEMLREVAIKSNYNPEIEKFLNLKNVFSEIFERLEKIESSQQLILTTQSLEEIVETLKEDIKKDNLVVK